MERGDDRPRIIHRQRRLGDIGDGRVVGQRQGGHIGSGGGEMHRPGDLAQGALDFWMAGMADQHDGAAFAGKSRAVEVDLGDQRAGGVEHRQAARLGRHFDAAGNAVGRKNGGGAVGYFVQFLDKHRAHRAQPVDHMGVVDDFMPDIDRRAVLFQRPFDDGDGAHDPGAKSAGRGQNDAQRRGGMIGVRHTGVTLFDWPCRQMAQCT